MVQDGRLPSWRDGKIKMPEGLAAYRAARAGGTAAAGDSEAAQLRRQLQQAQIRERIAKAEQREQQLRQERDELVDKAEVVADVRAAAEVVRAKLLALPQRVALQVEALVAGDPGVRAAQIEAVIADEVNEALGALHKMRFGAEAA